jgi:hypothetical protein
MAKRSTLTELPPAPRRRGKVDWDEVTDGTIWELTQGEDFDGKPGTFCARVRKVARERQQHVEHRIQEPRRNGGPVVVLVQFSANGAASANGDQPARDWHA